MTENAQDDTFINGSPAYSGTSLFFPIILKFWLIYTKIQQKLKGLGPKFGSGLNFLNNLFKNYPIWGSLVLVLFAVLTMNFSGLGGFAPALGGGPIGGELTEIVSSPSAVSDNDLFGAQTLAASIDPTDTDLEYGGFDSSLQTTGEDALFPSGNPETQSSTPSPAPAPTRPRTPSYSYGPDLGGYFIFPTNGYNRGVLHYYNAVDISAGNQCLSENIPVFAAASGVIAATYPTNSTSRYANGGYGNNIMVLHPNGVYTRYTHLRNILVTEGQYVNQGSIIAFMGGYSGQPGSGNSTGCHLHFEVRGARNPFIR